MFKFQNGNIFEINTFKYLIYVFCFKIFSCHPWAELIRPHLPRRNFDETDNELRSDIGLTLNNGLTSDNRIRIDDELTSDETIFSTSCVLLGRHVDLFVDRNLSLKCEKNPKQDLLRYQSVQFRRPV